VPGLQDIDHFGDPNAFGFQQNKVMKQKIRGLI
jgi:hypothetical protein